MTPDDTPVPNDDAVASAARRGLGRIAESGAPAELTWDGVQSGARRVYRRRFAAIGAACAVVLLGTGIAVAAAGRDKAGHLRVKGKDVPTATNPTTTVPPTTMAELPTTTLATGGPSGAVGTTTVPIPLTGPSSIEGTLTLASSTWVAEQPASFVLMVHNSSDREYRFAADQTLGIVVQDLEGGCIGVDHAGLVLGPGERRTFTSEYTPRPEMIGQAKIYTAVLWAGDNFSNCLSTDGFAGVPVVAVTIVPPGWVEGQPLDPSQGRWSALLSADNTDLGAGQTTAIHIGLRNVGNQPQRTDGYGSLAVVCSGPGIRDGFPVSIGSVTLEPGGAQTFTVAFPVDRIAGPGTFECSLDMTFHGLPSSETRRIDSQLLWITVHPETGTTTTTAPVTTTVPTAP